LHHAWSDDAFKPLAREIWNLQPPFGVSPNGDSESAFQILLFGPDASRSEDFDERLRPHLKLWHARITGRVLPVRERTADRNVEVDVEFEDSDRYTHEYVINPCPLEEVTFEIR